MMNGVERIILIVASLTAIAMVVRAMAPDRPQVVVPRDRWTQKQDTDVWRHRQVVIVFIGDTNCPVCTDPAFKRDLAQFIDALEERVAAREHRVLYKVGVIKSTDILASIDYLQGITEWAEISIGGSWTNSWLNDLVWERSQDGLTPSIFLFSREIVRTRTAFLPVNASPVREIRGSGELVSFLARGDWENLLSTQSSLGPS